MVHVPWWAARFRPFGILIAVLATLLVAAAPVAGAGPARVAITASTIVPGQFRYEVRGFFKDETLSTWLTGPNGQVVPTDDVQTDRDGRVTFKLFMPRHFQPGTWAITIVGQRSEKEVIETFDVSDRGTNVTINLGAASARAGDTISVTSAGFGEEERVSYWFTRPDGSAMRGPSTTFSAKDGAVAFDLPIPGDVEAGGWALSVYGDASDSYGVATFEIVA